MDSVRGRIVWFIGLSGAGKSTLCSAVASCLQQRGELVKVLDGDELRRGLCSDLGFSEEDRTENIRRISCVTAMLSSTGVTTLIATISPFQRLRNLARAHLPDMVEVYVDAPLATCEARDPKGLYRMARSGEIASFTGIDSPFEPPLSPDLVCKTAEESVEESSKKVLAILDHPFGPLHLENPRRSVIAVDFDGVIADYNGWLGETVLGEPRQDVITALQQLRDEGWKIVIHTTRGANDIRLYLRSSGVPFDEINWNSDYFNKGSKPVATVYWDDRALTYSGDASHDIRLIRTFQTWNGRN